MPKFTESERTEIARLYRMMDIPGRINVLHIGDKTWLADGFVLLDVTGSPVVKDLADGLYKIQLRNGFVPRDEPAFYKPAAWLERVHRYHWYVVRPTRWAPYPGKAKARLFYVEVPLITQVGKFEHYPLMLNEEIWAAFLARHPDARFLHPGFEGPFKVATATSDELAYIEPVKIPEDMQSEAIALVEAVHTQPTGPVREKHQTAGENQGAK